MSDQTMAADHEKLKLRGRLVERDLLGLIASARLLRRLGARPAARGGSAHLGERGLTNGRPATALDARASRNQSRKERPRRSGLCPGLCPEDSPARTRASTKVRAASKVAYPAASISRLENNCNSSFIKLQCRRV